MFSCLQLYGLPGGEQVDGLPPAASYAHTTKGNTVAGSASDREEVGIA